LHTIDPAIAGPGRRHCHMAAESAAAQAIPADGGGDDNFFLLK
jgi:hypothetical protein